MPQPIMPVHKLDAHEVLFDIPNTAMEGCSALQAIVFDIPTKTAAIKYEPRILDLLEKINKNEDELITAASNARTKSDEKYYKIPPDISDNDVLSLKAAGLLTGSSKTVKFTEKGIVALRSKWLGESNQLRTNRTKTKFEYRNAEAVEEEWWKGKALPQHIHNEINRNHFPGTRQLCSRCGEPTDRCEEDTLCLDDGEPLCEECYHNAEVLSNNQPKFMRESALKPAEGNVAKRCNCEHTKCHPNADCKSTDGLKLYEDHGMKVTLCPSCARKWVKTSSEKFTRISQEYEHHKEREKRDTKQAYLFPRKDTGTWWVEYFTHYGAHPEIVDTEIPAEWDADTATQMFKGAHPEIGMVDYFDTFEEWKNEVMRDVPDE